MTERLKPALKDVVIAVESSQLLRNIIAEEQGEQGVDEAVRRYAHKIASGFMKGESFLRALKAHDVHKNPLRHIAQESAVCLHSLSPEFKRYSCAHKIEGPIRIESCVLEENVKGRDLAKRAIQLLGLDVERIDEYEFRLCSWDNYSTISQATRLLWKFGIDRDLSKSDNMFWSLTGAVWGGRSSQSAYSKIVAVYHDPQHLINQERRSMYDDPIEFYPLVMADLNLYDLLFSGGVVIFNPKDKSPQT